MTDNNHPITPPPELVQQWHTEAGNQPFHVYIATQAARWGSDQELDACVEWICQQGYHPCVHKDLRADRRPKSPSLKEQALAALDEEQADMRIQNYKTIRSVLESLPDEQ